MSRPGAGARRRPRAGGDADARVVWPPKSRQSTRAAIEAFMRERGLARGFERHVERAARRARDGGLEAHGDLEKRRDLTELPTFTIDPASARDFDDAISAESLAEDGVRVWVHIADVSAFVAYGSPVDEEAHRRATSVYVPGAVEPMLPEALSNDACSLVPFSDRLAVTVELELRDERVAKAAFYRSVIRSDERLDYERVDRIFSGEEAAGEPWAASLQAAREGAAALQHARRQRGALVIETQEPEFAFDEQGNVSELRVQVQSESHSLIEQLMIAANEAVAERLHKRGVACLYRVHERPEPDRIERLLAQLASLDVPTPALPKRMSTSQASELLGTISARVSEHVRRTGRGRLALSSLVLRSLKQAYYSPKNVGHAGLRSPTYCHFTSPIRRYPDLVCHRALLSTIGANERAPRMHEMAELGEWTSQREREAMTIERDGDDVASCFVLERVLYEGGWEQTFMGEVVGMISAGAFVAFGRPSAPASPAAPSGPAEQATGDAAGGASRESLVFEGMLPVRVLQVPSGEREWWEINEQGTILHGERTGATLRLGDEVAVRVARVDVQRGRVDLLPAVQEAQGG